MKPSAKKVSLFLSESNLIEGYEYAPEDYLPALKNPSLNTIAIIKNSVRAWNYVLRHRTEHISHSGILAIHKALMRDLAPDSYVGVYRRGLVMVGGYTPPAPAVLHYHVQSYVDYVARPKSHPLHSHVLFEIAHPFYDGNGRTGRLLWAWDRILRGQKVEPILSFMKGESFDEKRRSYYMLIRHVQNGGTFDKAKELYCTEDA